MDKEYTVLRLCTRRENMITDEVDTNLRQKEEIFSIFHFWILRMNLVRQMLLLEKRAEFLYFLLTRGVSA